MATYIALINWTEKGVEDVMDSPNRADKARALAESLGGTMQQVFMTMGSFDLVIIVEMPNDEAMAKFVLKASASGHIRTTTLRAFVESDYREIVGSL